MSKSMLVNVTHVEESRLAIVEDGTLSSYEIETINRTNTKGNIYNAVVDSLHAALEAAFVRIGPDQKAFLPLDEVNFNLLPARGDRKGGKISQHLHPGQKLMVQSVREPFAGKPPTVSTYFSLPGRYLVLMPGVDSAGVSRKIEDGGQRDKLKKLVSELKVPDGFGLIVRTAGMGQTKTELQRDLRYLLRLWESIQRSSAGTEFPGLVYREADLVIRTMRDYLTSDIQEVWIDSEETFEKASRFVRDVMPTRAKILKRYDGEKPIFNRFNLEEQIERIYKRRVPLPAGGEIVIDGTEALTAIDVNSARSRRQADAEDNATQTNLEAAAEIARQLRLRDLGGLIVVDFIDMSKTSNKTKVEKRMRDALRGDKARYDVTKISKLGLMELARQRLKAAKMAASYVTCPDCDGHGLIKTIEAAGLSAFRKLQTRCARRDLEKVQLRVPADICNWILNQKREELIGIQRRHVVTIEVLPDTELLRHESRFTTFPRTTPLPAAPPAPPKEASSSAARDAQEGREASKASSGHAEPVEDDRAADDSAAEEPAAETEGATEEKPKRRRRGRRGGRGRGRGGSRGSGASGSSGDPDSSGSDDGAGDGSGNGSGDGPPPERDRPVPGSVRADELMPAAVGSADGQKSPSRRRGRRGGARRRRKGGSAAGD